MYASKQKRPEFQGIIGYIVESRAGGLGVCLFVEDLPEPPAIGRFVTVGSIDRSILAIIIEMAVHDPTGARPGGGLLRGPFTIPPPLRSQEAVALLFPIGNTPCESSSSGDRMRPGMAVRFSSSQEIIAGHRTGASDLRLPYLNAFLPGTHLNALLGQPKAEFIIREIAEQIKAASPEQAALVEYITRTISRSTLFSPFESIGKQEDAKGVKQPRAD